MRRSVLAAILLAAAFAFAQDAPSSGERPVVAKNHFVDPFAGEVVGDVPIESWRAVEPVEGEPGRYRVLAANVIVDAARRWTEKRPDELRCQDTRVTRRNERGEVVFEVILDAPVDAARPPAAVIASDRVIVSTRQGLRALDRATGDVKWSTVDRGDRLLVVGDIVFGAEWHAAEAAGERYVLVARDVRTGTAKWTATLPERSDVKPIECVNDRLLVRKGQWSDDWSRFYDRSGRLAFERKEWLEVLPRGEALLLVGKKTSLVSRKGEELWTSDAISITTDSDAVRGIELEGGDVLLARFGTISDSGVKLARLDAQGATVWKTEAAPLGTSHSKYRHDVYLERRGERFVVVSQGSHGCFVEARSLATGELEKRWANKE